MGRSFKFVTAGFGVLATLLVTDANALDCGALTKSTRTINMTVTATTNGKPSAIRTFRIERGGHTLVSALAVDGSILFKTQADGAVARWSESYPAGKPFRQDYQYVNVQGPLASLEEGATTSYELRSIASGNVILAVDARHTVGPHGSTTLGGCAVATVAIHRELLGKASQVRTTIDQLFAPELGYLVTFTLKSESASPKATREDTFGATSVEVEE
jgi:hypothetical protein